MRPVTFDSRELENLGKTVDLSREKIDKFLEVMTSKEVETGPVPAEPAPEKTPDPPTGTLPPWASTMKGAPVFPEDTGPVETRKIRGGEPASAGYGRGRDLPAAEGVGLDHGTSGKGQPGPPPVRTAHGRSGRRGRRNGRKTRRRKTRSKTGLPRRSSFPQARSGRPANRSCPPVNRRPERPARTEVEAAEEIEEPAPRPPFSFSVFFKSKAFDLLFVGLFWLVALWLAASSMGMTLFDILGSMSGSMLLLYAVFVLLYFFLFKFFLGETLGDRLFRPRE